MLFPEPDPARRWLIDELSRAEYQPSLSERIRQALSDLLDWLTRDLKGGSLPAWIFMLAAAVAVLALALALSRLRRDRRVTEAADVFDDVRRTAVEHRALAAAALADGDYATALIESVRAITAGLIDRDLLSDLPGVSSLEVLQCCVGAFPTTQASAVTTIRRFDEVRYGDRAPERTWAKAAADLDAQLSTLEPVDSASGPVLAVPR